MVIMNGRWRKTSVWWDIEKCEVPEGCDPYAITTNITSALVNAKYDSPSQIYAYADVSRMSSTLFRALTDTGVSIKHVSCEVDVGGKILIDMLSWALDNPAPANYLLISEDNFSCFLNQLRDRQYNILIAHSLPASSATLALILAANSIWCWKTLSAGGPPLSTSQLIQISRNCTRADLTPTSSTSPSSITSDSGFDTDCSED